MNPKLLRALQRGGCTSEIHPGKWAVWRQTDRRGRSIGEISDADVALMRLSGDLRPLGASEDICLVWKGGCTKPLGAVSASPEALWQSSKDQSAPQVSLLQRVLEQADSVEARQLLMQTAIIFAEDLERAMKSGHASGMNWAMIETGGRIQGGRRSCREGRIGGAARSARRLEKLSSSLTHNEFTLLRRMIAERCSRYVIAKWLGLPQLKAQNRAYAAMKHLAKLYRNYV